MLTVATDQDAELYNRAPRSRRRYRKNEGELREITADKLATVRENKDGYLEVVDTGTVPRDNPEEACVTDPTSSI